MRTHRSLLAAALALLALAAAPAAQAAVPGLNLGTSATPGGLIVPADVDTAADAGARSVRLFVEWRLIETADGEYEANRLARLEEVVRHARARGLTPVLAVFLTPGWANGGAGATTPPAIGGDAGAGNAKYAEFVGFLAGRLQGAAPVFEVWSEQDEPHFWAGAPEPARYADMLKRTKAATAGTDATVLFGALTGNNYTFFEQAFDQGGLSAGAFDGVAVHTDTACLSNPPSFYVRNVGPGLDGRINRYSFLGFRELRASMLARGVDRPIWMTELGWSTFQGGCEVPGFGDRAGGVTPEQQAAFITQAYQCLANYDYVAHAQVFDLYDRGDAREGRYGIFGKPAWDAFRALAAAPPAPGTECGDFTPPSVTEQLPAKLFNGPLPIRALAADASGVTRITLKADGQLVRNFTGADVAGGRLDYVWDGAKNLPFGTHRITVEAIDPQSNLGAVTVDVTRIDPEKFGKKLPARVTPGKLTVNRRTKVATVSATVTKSDLLQLSGKVQAVWEAKRPAKAKRGGRGGRGARAAAAKRRLVWTRVHRTTKSVSIGATATSATVTLKQKLKFARYRMKLVYVSKAPHKGFTTKYRTVKRP